LFLLEDNETYLHVGIDIFTFKTQEPIEKYFSPIGNSAVPYPFARSENYVYFMLENVGIPKKSLPSGKGFTKDPYQALYECLDRARKKYPLLNKKVLSKHYQMYDDPGFVKELILDKPNTTEPNLGQAIPNVANEAKPTRGKTAKASCPKPRRPNNSGECPEGHVLKQNRHGHDCCYVVRGKRAK
jgi:hypothetical protein